MKTKDSNRLTMLLLGLVIGWCVNAVTSLPMVTADVRQQQDSKVAFQSGGQRSVAILEKISKQITTLDQRLAKIEASVTGKRSGR
ncbi:MAG: hypothetical protein P8K08_10340 [Fuerstiella sp.]|jgi:hypothetical protein|nr:hypothetical protein [Fuerstiella sp.]